MQSIKPPKTALIMAMLGVISGLICTYPLEILTEFMIFETPVFHGLVFGTVIGLGNWRWGNGTMADAAIILVLTTVTWIGAVNGFKFVSEDAKTYLYPAALISGSIGAAGTLFGAALVNSVFRNLKIWLITIFVGALAGMFVVMDVNSTDGNFLALFVIWQSSIAFCFGLALNQSSLPASKR